MLRIRFLLTVVHYAVTTLDRSTGRAANAIALCIVRPAGVAVPRATPGAIEVVGSHGVPGRVSDIDSICGVTRPDNDPRSLRLNFEVDLEIMNAEFATKVEALVDTAMQSAKPVLLQSLRARSFWVRLLDRIIWLGSPYL